MLLDEIFDDSSSSSFLSNSSDSSMNTSSDSSSDEDEEMLVDECHAALFNSNVIVRQLVQTIAHEGINWHTNHTGLSIQDLSVDDALSSFDFERTSARSFIQALASTFCLSKWSERKNCVW